MPSADRSLTRSSADRSRTSLRALVRARERSRGLLIAFEGPDGAGKTTQRKLFKTWLKGEGHEVVTSKWSSSRLVRPLIKARKKGHGLGPEEFCLLHAGDFRHGLHPEILPALWQGKTVLADRFLFTGFARDAARGLDFDWLLHVYSPLFWPDMVLYFAVSADVSAKRIASSRQPKYYESGQDVTGGGDALASYRQVHPTRQQGVRRPRAHLRVPQDRRGTADVRAASSHPGDLCLRPSPSMGEVEHGGAGGMDRRFRRTIACRLKPRVLRSSPWKPCAGATPSAAPRR